jgi:hypothetical protein
LLRRQGLVLLKNLVRTAPNTIPVQNLFHCEAEGRGNLLDDANLATSGKRLLRFTRNDDRDLTRHYAVIIFRKANFG